MIDCDVDCCAHGINLKLRNEEYLVNVNTFLLSRSAEFAKPLWSTDQLLRLSIGNQVVLHLLDGVFLPDGQPLWMLIGLAEYDRHVRLDYDRVAIGVSSACVAPKPVKVLSKTVLVGVFS